MYDLKGGKDRISTMAGVDLGIVIAMQLGIMPLFPKRSAMFKSKVYADESKDVQNPLSRSVAGL